MHPQAAYRWFRNGTLPVPAVRVNERTILVSPDTMTGKVSEGFGLYARVSSHDQRGDLDRQVARLIEWAAEAGQPVVRVEAEVGSGMNGSRARLRRLLSDPKVTTVVVEHRDRLARMNAELVEAALSAHGRRLVILDDGEVDDDTARAYLAALERLMVVENQSAWAPRLRSRARLRSAPKRHFCDPSLAAAAVQATPGRLLNDLRYFGLLFESLVVRDLRVYAQHGGASVLHYRDNIGEVDAVVDDGLRWGAIEVKLGVAYVEQAAANLRRFIERVDIDHRGEPAFLGVVVPTRYGYRRDDGVHVIPVQALGP